MSTSRRVKVRRLLIRYVNFWAILMGITAHWLDWERRTVQRPRLLALYAACVNAALLVSLPFAFLAGLEFMKSYENNSFLRFTDVLTLTINFVVIALAIALRCQRQRELLLVSANLFDIDARYFDRQPPNEHIERRADYLLFLRFFTFCTQSGVIFASSLQLPQHLSLAIVLEAFYYASVQNVLGVIMFDYFYMLWLAYKRLLVLNERLQQLLRTLMPLHDDVAGLQQLCHSAAIDLAAMSRVHRRLTRLLARLNAAHKWQTTAVLLTYLVTNSAWGYFVALQTDNSMRIAPDWWFWLGSGFLMFVLFVDLSLLYWLADGITGACRMTPQLLRDSDLWSLTHVRLERQFEIFELQLKQQQLHDSIGGMFTLSRQTALALWAFTLRHTLFLVQCDYESRMGQTSPSLTVDKLNKWLNFKDH